MPRLLAWLAGALLFVGWSWHVGQDANWDLQNYHDYSAYALLHWRYRLDVAPAGFQAYLNPLPYVIPYLLRHHLQPLLAALLIAGLQSVVVLVAWEIACVLLDGRRWRYLLAALATLAGVTCAMALTEIGTSLADLILTPLVLASLLMLLRAERQPGRAGRALVLSGFFLGAACGLKLTNALYVPGLAVALLLPWRGWRPTWQAGLRIAAGGLAGLLLTDGAWAFYLWDSLQNPIFPGLNQVFRSASALPIPFTDTRFLPAGLWEALRYPWLIASGVHPTLEVGFADPRLLLAAPIGLVFVVGSLVWPADRAMLRAIGFFGVSMIVWLKLFAIERYALPGDMLAGLLIVPMLCALPRVGPWAALVVAVLAIGVTRPADFWHRSWDNAYAPHLPPDLAVPAAYLIMSFPDGYWASRLPAASRFYGLPDTGLAGGVLRAQMRDGLGAPPGGVVRTLSADIPMEPSARETMGRLGFAAAAPCERVASLWWIDTVFCAAGRVGPRPHAASDLALDADIDFTRAGSGIIYLLSGWAEASDSGVAMQQPGRLVFKPPALDAPLMLDIDLRRRQPGSTQMQVERDGKVVARWAASDDAAAVGHVCLPADPDGVVVVLSFAAIPAALPYEIWLRSMRLHRAAIGAC